MPDKTGSGSGLTWEEIKKVLEPALVAIGGAIGEMWIMSERYGVSEYDLLMLLKKRVGWIIDERVCELMEEKITRE